MDMYDNTSKGHENNTIHYCRFPLNSWFISFCKLRSIHVKEMCFDIKYLMWPLKQNYGNQHVKRENSEKKYWLPTALIASFKAIYSFQSQMQQRKTVEE